jgi:hypothetical protein
LPTRFVGALELPTKTALPTMSQYRDIAVFGIVLVLWIGMIAAMLAPY